MKVVLLAGGYGTRLSEYTDSIPKPMVEIGKKPILWHIMNTYSSFGYNDFYVALGYKADYIKNYFLNYKSINNNFSVNLKSGNIKFGSENLLDWNINLIDTGLNTMTGGRLKKLKKYLNETFLLTYGDGVANVNLNKLINFHKKNKKLITLTAVRPPARFGAIKIKNNVVKYFREKNSLDSGWINGGFFVINPKFIDYIKKDSTYLEQEPFKRATKNKQLLAFKHKGFWQCMDTLRDKEILENKIKELTHLE